MCIMKVKDLIKKLQKEDPNRLVVLSGDSEGNSHYELNSYWLGSYKDGEVGLEKLTKRDLDEGYGEDDVVKGQKALILT
jgi:hypothetical protein